MKYWRGYLVALVIGAFTLGLVEFAANHTVLVDMIWPYLTRTYQTFMAGWSSDATYCVWQLLVSVLCVLALASIVLMIILRWNPVQWFGWVLAVASLVMFVHTGIYGLNAHAGSIANDIHLQEREYSLGELEEATAYFCDKANALAGQVKRNGAGEVLFSDFATLANQAGAGFEILVNEHSCSVYAGSTAPVKELGWADMYTSMGVTGVTVGITGEAAVNPQTPDVGLPFAMCHEMAHRMSIVTERDADFSGFLACLYNPSPEFQYSAYFMAYRYCYNSLEKLGASAAAGRVSDKESGLLRRDLTHYDASFASQQPTDAAMLGVNATESLFRTAGEADGEPAYSQVTDLLVCWHIQHIVIPSQQGEEQKFDPFDPNQVDLTGLVNATP